MEQLKKDYPDFDEYIFYSKRFTVEEGDIQIPQGIRRGDIVETKDVGDEEIFDGHSLILFRKYDVSNDMLIPPSIKINNYPTTFYFHKSVDYRNVVWLRQTLSRKLTSNKKFGSGLYKYTTDDGYIIYYVGKSFETYYKSDIDILLRAFPDKSWNLNFTEIFFDDDKNDENVIKQIFDDIEESRKTNNKILFRHKYFDEINQEQYENEE